MNRVRFVLCVSLLSAAFGQEFASECPELNGLFADAIQCDKYYSCVDGLLSESFCVDGFVFNENSQHCDFPFQVDCKDRPELQPASPTPDCPRQNGYFAHKDPSICNEFFFCNAGIGSKIICPETLVFSLKTGTCVWPNEAGRSDCTSQSVHNYTCPKVPFEVAVAHPRYADPDDCQYFYVCINGVEPRRNGCKFGQVFNAKTTACDNPVNVLECEDFYREYFENYFANKKSGAGVSNIDVLAAAIASGYDIPGKPKRVKINRGTTTRSRTPIDASPAASEVAEPEPSVAKVPVVRTPARAPAPVREKVPSRRFPSRSETAVQGTPPRDEAPAETAPAQPARPVNRRRPSGDRPARRRPLRRRPQRKQTTTTTTTTEEPFAYDDYYYYDDVEPVAQPAAA